MGTQITSAVNLATKDLSWFKRQLNRLPIWKLGKVSGFLADKSHDQNLKISSNGSKLSYFNERVEQWVEITASGSLARHLGNRIENLTLTDVYTPEQMESFLVSLARDRLSILSGKFADSKITVKDDDGREIKVPISWNNLYEDIAAKYSDIDHLYFGGDLSHVSGWLVGAALGLGSCAYGVVTEQGDATAVWGIGGVLLGYSAGRLLAPLGYLLIQTTVWASKRLYRMARFARDYETVFRLGNETDYTSKDVKIMRRIFNLANNVFSPHKEEGTAAIIPQLPIDLVRDLAKDPKSNVGSRNLFSHAEITEAEMRHQLFVESKAETYDEFSTKVALAKLKTSLTTTEIESLPILDKYFCIKELLELDNLPTKFWLSYLTGKQKINAPAPSQSIRIESLIKIYDKIKGDLTGADLGDFLGLLGQEPNRPSPKLYSFLEQLFEHPKISKAKEAVTIAIKEWLPFQLITEKALPLITDSLQEKAVLDILQKISGWIQAEEDRFSDEQMKMAPTEREQLKETVIASLINHPASAKQVALHVIHRPLPSYRISVFERDKDAFSGQELEAMVSLNIDSHTSYKPEPSDFEQLVLAHPKFPRARLIAITNQDSRLSARKLALQNLKEPAPAEVTNLLEGNFNKLEMLEHILSFPSIKLEREHQLYLCTHKEDKVWQTAWQEVVKQSLSNTEIPYLIEKTNDAIRHSILTAISKDPVDVPNIVLLIRCSGADLQLRALTAVHDHLSIDEIDALSQLDLAYYTLISLTAHPKIIERPIAMARILCNKNIIPPSQKVVDEPAHTEYHEEQEYGSYGEDLGTNQVPYEVPERFHFEYNDADGKKGAQFFADKSLDYIKRVLGFLADKNPQLADLIRQNIGSLV